MTRISALAAVVLVCCAGNASTVRVSLPPGFHPQTMAAADFDGDGRTEVAVCGREGQLAIISGGRATAKGALCGSNPFGIIATDLNGDRRPDLLIANHDTDYVTVVRNEGGGRFTSLHVHVHSKPHPHTVAAADVNGDAKTDIITDSWAENRVTLLLADGRGGWQSPGVPVDTGRGPYVNVIAADLDGDGHADLVMPNARPDDPHDSLTILFGDGHGRFERAAQSPITAGPAPFMIAVADVNGDGRPDIVVANYSGHITSTAEDGLTWIRNDGRRHFTAFTQRVAAGRGTWHIAAGDLNGDRFSDAAFINAGDATVTVVYGSPDGPRPGATLAVMPQPQRVIIADHHLFVIGADRDEVWIVPVK